MTIYKCALNRINAFVIDSAKENSADLAQLSKLGHAFSRFILETSSIEIAIHQLNLSKLKAGSIHHAAEFIQAECFFSSLSSFVPNMIQSCILLL